MTYCVNTILGQSKNYTKKLYLYNNFYSGPKCFFNQNLGWRFFYSLVMLPTRRIGLHSEFPILEKSKCLDYMF